MLFGSTTLDRAGHLAEPQAWTVLWNYWRAGGWLMIPLALIVFLIWHQCLSLTRRLRAALAKQDETLAGFETRLPRDPHDPETDSWLAAQPGSVPRLLRHVLHACRLGLPFREALAQARQVELGTYSHACLMLAALVAAAPLLGLLGTVFGMIETFDGVAQRSGQTADMVAAGISQALITTQVGLVAALPGTFGLAHIYRLYTHLRHAVDHGESLLALALEGPQRTSHEPHSRHHT